MRPTDEQEQEAMRHCKRVAREHGLTFDVESVEYVATIREFLDLRAKVMIPTHYDHWLDRIETERGRREYEITRNNPFETVINTRPAVSFYNDTNPTWLNRMIYYHVLGHIDFFQNNQNFAHTWNDDFRGKALADSRLIETLRREHGRWVDYAIEFSRSVSHLCRPPSREHVERKPLDRVTFLFEQFLPNKPRAEPEQLLDLLNREGEERVLALVREEHPAFDQQYERASRTRPAPRSDDILQFIMERSDRIAREENAWMRDIIAIVRATAQYFHPQGNTKIMNEGWASYWHEELFPLDPASRGHEVEFAIIDSHVVSHHPTGLNPYALGLALFRHVEENAQKGKDTRQYELVRLLHDRERFDLRTGRGRVRIFEVRREYDDFTFINEFLDQEFIDKNKLYVVGERRNEEGGYIERYIKSRHVDDYRRMVLGHLPHYPSIRIDVERTERKRSLNLEHLWEGEELHEESLNNALIGLEHLWGSQVNLRTREFTETSLEILDGLEPEDVEFIKDELETAPITWTCKDQKVVKNKGGRD